MTLVRALIINVLALGHLKKFDIMNMLKLGKVFKDYLCDDLHDMDAMYERYNPRGEQLLQPFNN